MRAPARADTSLRYWLVMPAAGSSQRFGGALRKPFAPLAGHTLLAHSLQTLRAHRAYAGGVLAVAAEDRARPEVTALLDARLSVVAGGARRCDSVLCALGALAARAAPTDWVLVHDAARPCLSAADLERLLVAGSTHAVGALLAAPMADTVKRAAPAVPGAEAGAGGAGEAATAAAVPCEGTVDRATLWRALTPQMFRYAPLCAALRRALQAGRAPTDEAQAFEWLGQMPLLVPSRESNIKVTTAEDLAVAAAVLAARAHPRPAGEGP